MTVNELKTLPDLRKAVERQAAACQSAKEAIEYLNAGITRITARMELAGGGGSGDHDKLAEFVSRKEEYEKSLGVTELRYLTMKADYDMRVSEAYSFMRSLTDVEAQVVEARYLSDDWERRGKWEGLARRMYMTVDGLHSARKRALAKLEK